MREWLQPMWGPLAGVVSGAIVMGYVIVGFFFHKFWRQTHDRLFLAFAVAFALLAIQRLAWALSGSLFDEVVPLLLIRLVAYSLILLAIYMRNLGPQSPRPPQGSA